jgi:hypothetical protein
LRKSCELERGLRVEGCELRVASCELRVAEWSGRFHVWVREMNSKQPNPHWKTN